MTRVPSDDPGPFEPGGVADRLAAALRRHLLAAAQASLRALREVLAQLPTAESGTRRPAKIEPSPARPAAARAKVPPVPPESRPRSDTPASPPPAELLRSDAALPGSYGSDRLVLLPRDPHCLYAYWDLSDARCRSVRTQTGSDRLRTVLRTYDVTQVSFDARPPTRFQDFTVVGDPRSVYAYVGKPAACYVAEIGYLRPDGVFFPLARSQPVWTPRTDQPGTAPGRWMTVGWSERREAGAVMPLAPTGPASVGPSGRTDHVTTERPATTESPMVSVRQGPSSWPGPSPSAAQRGSWSLVRGRLTTATSPDDPPAARSEP